MEIAFLCQSYVMRFKYYLLVSTLAVISSAALAFLATQPFVTPVVSHPPEVNQARLEVHVKDLSVDLYPRSFDQAKNIERAAEYIRSEFSAVGADVFVQEINVEGSKYKNIIARFGPASGPLLVIGAHYDSQGEAVADAKTPSGFDSKTYTPGADDNASGVAGLLELARLLHNKPPSRAVELVAYTLEELPYFDTEHMGSVWHARSLAKNNRQVQLMLSLEMIGYFSDEANSQHFIAPGMDIYYPDRGSFIALVGKFGDFDVTRRVKSLMAGATNLPVYSLNGPNFVSGVDFSDHRSYWSEGYPALMITDTAFYRNKNYHLASDTYEKLDYQRMAKVVQSVYAIAQNY